MSPYDDEIHERAFRDSHREKTNRLAYNLRDMEVTMPDARRIILDNGQVHVFASTNIRNRVKLRAALAGVFVLGALIFNFPPVLV